MHHRKNRGDLRMNMMEATFEGMPGLIAPARSTAESDFAKVTHELRNEQRDGEGPHGTLGSSFGGLE